MQDARNIKNLICRHIGSADRAGDSQPIREMLRLQTTITQTETRISQVFIIELPILFFHTNILPESAELSRGYFNFFMIYWKVEIVKEKNSIIAVHKPGEKESSRDIVTGAPIFPSVPGSFVKNPALGAEHLIPLLEIPFFPQNAATFGQKSGALNSTSRTSLQNRIFSSKIPCFRQKSRFFLQNLVHLPMHLVLSSKIPCNCQKSRATEKNPVQLLKISCNRQKSRAIEKNPVQLLKIPCNCQKSRAFRSLPGFIDISGHSQIHAASILNTDALVQDSYPFKTSIPLPGRGKPNLNLKININKE